MFGSNGGVRLGLIGLLIGLVAFDIFYGVAIVRTLLSDAEISWNAPTLYLGSMAFGLVGGIIAAGAGVDWTPPKPPPAPGAPTPQPPREATSNSLPQGVGAVSLGATLSLSNEAMLRWLGRIWVGSFIVITVGGVAALVTRFEVVSDFIATFATSAFGLWIAAGRAFFTRHRQ